MRAHVELVAALGVAFAAEGCEILAVGNSDPRGYDSFKNTASHPLRFGRAAVYLRLRAGVSAQLTASADGLRPATVAIESAGADPAGGLERAAKGEL